MEIRRRLGSAAVLALAVFAAAPAGAPGAVAPSRYTLANGCYALQASSGRVIVGGERLRLQATTLGSYLLYRPDRTFLAAHDDGSIAADQQARPSRCRPRRRRDAS